MEPVELSDQRHGGEDNADRYPTVESHPSSVDGSEGGAAPVQRNGFSVKDVGTEVQVPQVAEALVVPQGATFAPCS